MSDIEDLEPHQYQNIYTEADAPPNDVSERTSQSMIYFGVFLVILLMVLSLVLEIPRELNIPFVLKSHNSEHMVQYPEQVFILKKYIAAGENIHRGDSLFQITGSQIVKLIQQHHTAQNLLKLYNDNKRPLQTKQLELLLNKKERAQQFMAQAKEKIVRTQEIAKKSHQNLKRQVVLLQDKYHRDSLLYTDRAISLNDLIASESQLQGAIANQLNTEGNNTMQVLNLQNSLETFEAELKNTNYQLQNLQLEIEVEHLNLQDKLQQVANELKLIYGPHTVWNNSLILLSANSGTISMVTNADSEIQPGQVVYKIRYATNQLYASLKAAPIDAGQLKKGQQVVLKLSSFPHYYYGSMQAAIAHISTSPNEEGIFPVEVHILDEGDLKGLGTTGLDGRATIILENKTVFDHVFRKVLKVATPD